MKKSLGRKNVFLLLVLSVLVILTGCSSSADVQPPNNKQEEKKTTEQIVQESFEKWYSLDSYDMDLMMNMKMSVGGESMNMDMKGQGTVFQNPMRMKMVMETAVPGMDKKLMITQYMVEEDQKITLYQQMEGQWFKMIMDDPAMVQMMDPMDNLQLFMDNLIQTETVGEEKIADRDTMKIELIASEKIFDELLNGITDESLGMNDDILNTEVLSKIGDVKYTIWVDKDSLDIVKSYMDLTDNMRNLAAAISENQDTPEELKEVFANMEISMEYTVYNQNKSADFSIPQEAKNAMELSASGV